MDSQSVNHSPDLPRELWIQIFNLLSRKDLLRSSTVCKEFYSYAMDPILWKTLDLKLSLDNLRLQQNLLSRCTMLLTLQLRGPATSHSETPKEALDSLADVLSDKCIQLGSLQTMNCPNLSTDQIAQLTNKTTVCSIKQTTHFIMNNFGSNDYETTGTWQFNDQVITCHEAVTTDYYRKGNPYKILASPGSSIISFSFNISLERLSSVSISLNHCRTTADGVVCMTVNGKPAEMREDGSFVKKVIMAPRYNFGMESFSLCLQQLHDGQNKVTICLDSSSPGVYWLSDATIETFFT
eukprot:GFUD01131209.1.p1 GENE.GFUD01131209.1~~GFUD01131209.1.p1  ORF type:complete len:295 (+),score=49.28 GFUD01131209.1:79-963(+)